MKAATVRARLAQPWRHGTHVDLAGARIDDALDLSGLDLAGVDFSGARFSAGIVATGARFRGLAWFRDAVFDAEADFRDAVFDNDARFDAAVFAARADFGAAEFRGIGRFDRARFEAGIRGGAIVGYGNFSLHETEISQEARFADAEWLGGLWAEGARFPPTADFSGSEVHGRLWIKRARRGAVAVTRSDYGVVFGYCYQ